MPNDFDLLIKDLIKDISMELAQESEQETKNSVSQLQTQVRFLKQELINAKNYKNNTRQDLTEKMKKTYSFIMKFRTSLLGFDKISYKLYLRFGDNLSDVKITTLSEDELLKYIERSQNVLRLKRNLNIEKFSSEARSQAIFNHHFANIQASLSEKGQNLFVVPIDKVRDITNEEDNANLYWQKSATKRGPHPYTPKRFNRGWIYQAFESTIQELYTNEEKTINTADFRREYFVNQLKFDNKPAFTGGDVGFQQIKSNAADLINLNTLISYLEKIEDILEPSKYRNKEELSQKILKDFTDGSSLSKSVQDFLDNTINNLLNNKNLTQTKNF